MYLAITSIILIMGACTKRSVKYIYLVFTQLAFFTLFDLMMLHEHFALLKFVFIIFQTDFLVRKL